MNEYDFFIAFCIYLTGISIALTAFVVVVAVAAYQWTFFKHFACSDLRPDWRQAALKSFEESWAIDVAADLEWAYVYNTYE